MNKKVILAGLWITFSEFLRNEILFKSLWVKHYQSLNLKFETKPINGILWLVWSMLMAYIISQLVQKFSTKKALLISWITCFLMMWITLFNLQVLPFSLLIFALPLSLIEIAVAIHITKSKK